MKNTCLQRNILQSGMPRCAPCVESAHGYTRVILTFIVKHKRPHQDQTSPLLASKVEPRPCTTQESTQVAAVATSASSSQHTHHAYSIHPLLACSKPLYKGRRRGRWAVSLPSHFDLQSRVLILSVTLPRLHNIATVILNYSGCICKTKKPLMSLLSLHSDHNTDNDINFVREQNTRRSSSLQTLSNKQPWLR
jgi:hypothetical protein